MNMSSSIRSTLIVNRQTSCAGMPNVAVVIVTSTIVAYWAVMSIFGSQVGVTSSIFVCRDVAAVYCLTALPLACIVALTIEQYCHPLRPFAISSALLAISALVAMNDPISFDPQFQVAMGLSLLRTVAAFGLVFALVAVTMAIFGQQRGLFGSAWESLAASLLGIILATVPPAIYVEARCRHEATELSELTAQSRFREAQFKLDGLMRLFPSMNWKGRPLKFISQEIDVAISNLESAVAAPMGPSVTDELRLERCCQLAMLGRTRDALAQLGPLRDSPARAAACDLCGTIYETKSQWETARIYHDQAKQEWSRQPANPQRRARLIRAATRLGHCERKLGHYDLAEKEYQQALSLAPTADTHFLLAQFYEDVQQSAKAHLHARRAMALDPQRYSRDGTKLIENLTVMHFGCLGVFRAEINADRPAPQVHN